MYICHCNPFSDRDVKEFFGQKDGKTSVAETYRHCSGGEKPGCCTCINTLKAMVRDHNGNVTVDEMQRKLPARRKRAVTSST